MRRSSWYATAVVAMLLATGCRPAVETSSDAIPWSRLRNPVHGFTDISIKDAAAVKHDGRWFFFYSSLQDEPFRFRLGLASTTDWISFDPGTTLDDPQVGGLASPDVAQTLDGRFVMAYNSHTHDIGETSSKLYYRTSTDLLTWTDATRIHVDGADAPENRLIDAAFAFTSHGAFLAFKREQSAQMAYSPSGSLDGPWTLLGPLSPANLENYQLLRIDGRWHLLATMTVDHKPLLYQLDGDESDPQTWRQWTLIRELEVPEQSWNTGDNPLVYEHANAAYLIDERTTDGFFYLLYAGSTEVSTFSGRGHSSLGLARSTDLEHWEVPPEQ